MINSSVSSYFRLGVIIFGGKDFSFEIGNVDSYYYLI